MAAPLWHPSPAHACGRSRAQHRRAAPRWCPLARARGGDHAAALLPPRRLRLTSRAVSTRRPTMETERADPRSELLPLVRSLSSPFSSRGRVSLGKPPCYLFPFPLLLFWIFFLFFSELNRFGVRVRVRVTVHLPRWVIVRLNSLYLGFFPD